MEVNHRFFDEKSLVTLPRRSLAPRVVVLECHQMAHCKALMVCYILICSMII